MIASFALLHPRDLDTLPKELTVVLFPVGGLEQHGPHLPFGTKLLQAEVMARKLAEGLEKRMPAWNFVLMPLIPLTVDGVTNRFALPVRPHVVRDAVVDQAEHLKRLGFKNFIVVNSHHTPKQITALEDAAKLVNGRLGWMGRKFQMVSISGALVDAKTVFESPMIALPDEHGGERDTSFMLANDHSAVLTNYRDLPEIPRPKASVLRFFDYLNHRIDGYWGRPSHSSAQNGETDFSTEMNLLVERLLPWLEKGQGSSQFLSAYRFFPFNGSFFKAYILSVILFVMMMVWAVWSMRDVFEP
ncbi:MAG: creatininase family protein [Bdellovibrionales bacterium]|nr:creatininase family protein [Bdellovibrionales bacterium]